MLKDVVIVVAFLIVPIVLVRFLPRWVAAFNLAVTNKITGPFAGSLPGFGIITHVGRKSGKTYHTPVNVFRTPDGFFFALTYGPNSEWVKNIMAAGGAELETRRQHYHVSDPKLVHDPSRRRFPIPVRLVLLAIGADHFLQVAAK